MRKNVVFSLLLAVCVVVLSFACVKTDASVTDERTIRPEKVITVAKNESVENPVLEARFLNMLNHNFVYNDDFYDDNALVDNSILALLDVADGSYVADSYVKDYIFNMYGKIYEGSEEGVTYIVPRGYSLYSHEMVSVTDNNDGSFIVVTNVTISYEDGTEETLKAQTLFLEASDSAFGYNIMYSDIMEENIASSDC
jgi:hypothetical protein